MLLLKGFAIDNADHEVTHLQFAGDTILFCDASWLQAYNLKIILKWFEFSLVLKINYGTIKKKKLW